MNRKDTISKDHPALLPVPDDMEGKVMVLDAKTMHERFQSARQQCFVVTGGFGAKKGNIGTKVFGYHLFDDDGNERTAPPPVDSDSHGYHRSYNFIGEASEGLLAQVRISTGNIDPIDPALRDFFVITSEQRYAHGDTLADALKSAGAKPSWLEEGKGGKVKALAFYTHPEAYVNDFGQPFAPAGTEITRVYSLQHARDLLHEREAAKPKRGAKLKVVK